MPPVIFETEILESSTSAHAAKSALHTALSNQTTGQCHIWLLARFSSLTTLPNWITADYWARCKFPTLEFHQLPFLVLQILDIQDQKHIQRISHHLTCLFERVILEIKASCQHLNVSKNFLSNYTSKFHHCRLLNYMSVSHIQRPSIALPVIQIHSQPRPTNI